MHPLVSHPLVEQALIVWAKGGWAMYALMANCVLMYLFGANLLIRLLSKGPCTGPDFAWRRYWANPAGARGTAARIIRLASAQDSPEQMGHYFDELKHEELAPFSRDILMMKVFVASAPLLGLLGTVTGMLATFGALATGSGGDKTMNMVAGGISEALITTETGLLLAITGLMFLFGLSRQHDRFVKYVEHLESLCMQQFHGKPAAATTTTKGEPHHE